MGWFDCVASRYGCRMQGTTDVAFTVLDVLGYLEEIPVCVAYEIDGKEVRDFPPTHLLEKAKPVIKKLPGWNCDIRGIRKYEELPENCRKYIELSLIHICVAVPVDRDGMQVAALMETGADIAYVTPSHQYPTGIVMPVRRRMELLRWAGEDPGRYIIEDDYDSEFRYKGKPIPALQGYDSRGQVIYLGTFSKSIAPAIRLSYMVLTEPLLERYKEQHRFINSTVSKVDQMIVQKFIEEGYYLSLIHI